MTYDWQRPQSDLPCPNGGYALVNPWNQILERLRNASNLDSGLMWGLGNTLEKASTGKQISYLANQKHSSNEAESNCVIPCIGGNWWCVMHTAALLISRCPQRAFLFQKCLAPLRCFADFVPVLYALDYRSTRIKSFHTTYIYRFTLYYEQKMKTKAHRIAPSVWEQYRDEITALYQKETLKKTMDTMEERYGFKATYAYAL